MNYSVLIQAIEENRKRAIYNAMVKYFKEVNENDNRTEIIKS